MNLELLDNPIWFALSTNQQQFAFHNSHAKLIDPDFGPFGAIQTPSAESFEALRQLLISNQATTAWFTPLQLEIPAGLECLTRLSVRQMICQQLEPTKDLEIDELSATDVPAMLELVQLTKPGPFGKRSIELGQFWGIRVKQKLVAMTGERMHLPGFREVSAVCTHPDFRGQGFARALIAKVCQNIVARGEIPFLHVMKENAKAAQVYEQLGFVERQQFHGYVLRARSSEVKT